MYTAVDIVLSQPASPLGPKYSLPRHQGHSLMLAGSLVLPKKGSGLTQVYAPSPGVVSLSGKGIPPSGSRMDQRSCLIQ